MINIIVSGLVRKNNSTAIMPLTGGMINNAIGTFDWERLGITRPTTSELEERIKRYPINAKRTLAIVGNERLKVVSENSDVPRSGYLIQSMLGKGVVHYSVFKGNGEIEKTDDIIEVPMHEQTNDDLVLLNWFQFKDWI